MAKGRPLAPLSIAEGERSGLASWSRRRTPEQVLAVRARMFLLAADGLSNTAVAEQVSTTLHTVGKWRQRFLDSGIDGLLDEQRPGTSRKLSDEDVERVLTLTLESKPAHATHWSPRSLSQPTGLTRASIHRIWRSFALAPQASETFQLAPH